MTSTPEQVDERLLAAEELARAALHEVTAPETVGPAAGYLPEADGVVSLRFENRLGGYPGWYWTVSVARVDDAEPTVLEVELLPGDGALLAPEWVPWAVRLADYQAAQAVLAEAADTAGEDSDDLDDDVDDDLDDEDDDELEDDELDSDGSPILHAGDLDGVDIDELDDESEDDESEDDDSEDDDSDADETDESDDEELREY